MKMMFEHGDLVLYPVANDGQGHKVYEYGTVQGVIGNNLYLGGNVIISADSVLPCMEVLKNIMDDVQAAHKAGAHVYGYKEYAKGKTA